MHQVKVLSIRLDHQWIGSLANFALEGLPKIRNVIVAGLHSFLIAQPHHEAVQVNEADTARALATTYKWVVRFGLTRPAETTIRAVLRSTLNRSAFSANCFVFRKLI